MTEMWLDRVARTVGKPLQAVRELNLYSEGDRTHYGQVLNGCQVGSSWLVVSRLAVCSCMALVALHREHLP